MKARFVGWLCVGVGILLSASCRRQDMRTVTIRVPEMKTALCATIVATALQKSQSLPASAIHADVSHRTVTVTYDSLLRARKNLEFAIADAGFAADDTPADPRAAADLPEGCR